MADQKKTMYRLGIVTELKSGCLDYAGKLHHDTTTSWSQPKASIAELFKLATEHAESFKLADNQYIVIKSVEQ